MSALITALASWIGGEVVTAALVRFGFVGTKAAIAKRALPYLLKAAKAGLDHLDENDRKATEEEIKRIEASGAAKSSMRGWF